MKTENNKLPKMEVTNLYRFKDEQAHAGDPSHTASICSDPTTNCGTILTTTHLRG